MPSVLSPFTVRDVTARNRFVVSPMCQYSCNDRDGLPTDWHRVHLGSRAVGGAGIVMTEATAIEKRGRISPQDLGIWSDNHRDALAPIAEFIESQGAIPGIQLAHAGRKGSTTRPFEGYGPLSPADGGWTTVAPSAIPYPHDGAPPETRELTTEEVGELVDSFRDGARRARDAGFSVVEVHAAHGYLLHQFLSPVTNDRTDAYGGNYRNRTRIVREIVSAVRDELGEEHAVFVRVSATDWLDDRPSWTLEQTVKLADDVAALGADLVDVSTGGVHPDQAIDWTGPNYQVRFAEQIRQDATSDIAIGTVGGITTGQQADALVRNGRADLAIVGRKFLDDPHFPIHAARDLGRLDEIDVPPQYARGF